MRKILDSIDYIDLYEAKTKLLTAFEDKFGKEFVYSPELSFDFTAKNLKALYKILNVHFFANKLDFSKLITYGCTLADLQKYSKQKNILGTCDDCYAAYVPEINRKTGKIVNESMFFIDDYGKKTFLFAAACLFHEMIHQYDARYGILSQVLQQDEKLGIDRSHQTPVFVRYMQFAAMEGLRVMTNGNNTPYDILNREAIQFTANLQEEADMHFKELVKRLEAGEKIPNVVLTNRGTVAFFIP